MAERKIVILVSGEIASGKTTLAIKLEKKFGFSILKTREAIHELARKKLKGNQPDRSFLQLFGATLDKKEDGSWVLNYFQGMFSGESNNNLFVVDSIRILKQVAHFRKAFSFSVYHIHLSASENCLKERFFMREEIKHLSREDAENKYHQAKRDETEQQVYTLSEDADLNIDTEHCTEDDVLVRAASYLKLLAPTNNGLVDVLIGAQFGSEGKGQIAAHIAPEYDCLIRTSDPSDGHTVYEEPMSHIFQILPSGSHRNQGAKLVLGAGTILNVNKLLEEISKYNILDEFNSRLVIDENAVIINDKDIEQEDKLKKSSGTTSEGVEFATANNLLARLHGIDKHKAKNHPKLKPFIGSASEVLEFMYKNNKRVLLEGSQGSGMSLYHGIYPYVSSRDTTVSGCLSEAGISPKRVNKIIMATRTYPIRSCPTSGNFLSNEIDMQTVSKRSGVDFKVHKKKHLGGAGFVNERIAEFSWTLFRKACELNSPTEIALTFADYLSSTNSTAKRYDQLTPRTKQFIEELEMCSGVKVSLVSTCFDYRSIIDRRNY